MTAMMTPAVGPIASFVVEREVGRGYRVTRSEGPGARHLADSALAILDVLGQPDPRDPETVSRWLMPDQAFGYPVGVRVTRLSNGEVRYEQTWFAAPTKEHRSPLWVVMSLLLAGISGLVGGSMAERYHLANEPAPPPPVSLVESQHELRDIQAVATRAEKPMRMLIDSLEMAPPPTLRLDDDEVASKTIVSIEKKAALEGDGHPSVLHYAAETFDAADAARLLALLRRLQRLQGGGNDQGALTAPPQSQLSTEGSPSADRQLKEQTH